VGIAAARVAILSKKTGLWYAIDRRRGELSARKRAQQAAPLRESSGIRATTARGRDLVRYNLRGFCTRCPGGWVQDSQIHYSTRL